MSGPCFREKKWENRGGGENDSRKFFDICSSWYPHASKLSHNFLRPIRKNHVMFLDQWAMAIAPSSRILKWNLRKFWPRGIYAEEYDVRSSPKFMVWILNCSFKFQLKHLNFTAEFIILHSSFRVHIIGKRFYTKSCRLAFELNFFIWACFVKFQPPFRQSPRQISNSTSYIF